MEDKHKQMLLMPFIAHLKSSTAPLQQKKWDSCLERPKSEECITVTPIGVYKTGLNCLTIYSHEGKRKKKKEKDYQQTTC